MVPLFEYGDQMSKVASSLDHVPGIQKYIDKARPEDGWYTLLIHAMGTDEVWGANKKADSFQERELNPKGTQDYGYKTFEKRAMGYVHHKNDPAHWTGRVLMAEFSEPMGRVELIAKFNIKRLQEEGAPYFAEMLDRGELPAVSMGTRVPYDVCCVCGNRATTPMDYCDDMRTRKLSILPDGRRVRVFNIRPVMHDISLVGSPADIAARVLLKVAEDAGFDFKLSAIEKRSPAEPIGGIRRLSRNEYAATISTRHDPDLTLDTLIAASRLNKHAGYSAFTAAGILLRPHEFLATEFLRAGKVAEAAAVLQDRTEIPVYDSPRGAFTWADPDSVLSTVLEPWIPQRSLYFPALAPRLEQRKHAEVLDTRYGTLRVPEYWHHQYSGYRKSAEGYLADGTASRWAYDHPRTLVRVLGHDIPIFLKHASLDNPKMVFGSIVRGANLNVHL